jgi:GT2 family glycosyltransferase
MERLSVSAILVTWNSAEFLPRCLDHLQRQTVGFAVDGWPLTDDRRPTVNGQQPTVNELVHVDNASADDSAAIVRGAFPGCTQIVNETNRGFTGAVNQAIARARGDFVLLLNPDAFLEPDYVARVVAAMNEAGEEFGMGTGKLMRATATGVVDSKGIRMTRTGRHLDIGQGLPDGADDRGLVVRRSSLVEGQLPTNDQRPTTNYEVFGVSGAAAVYRMSFVRDVSVDGEFLDEDFFTYREDADVAWRGRVLGWRALYVPAAVGVHVRRVTPEARRHLPESVNRDSVRNRFLLRLKNEGLYLALRNAPFELSRDLLTIAAVLTVERSSLPALAWLWKNRRRIMAKRRAIQSRRRTPDRELAGWFR